MLVIEGNAASPCLLCITWEEGIACYWIPDQVGNDIKKDAGMTKNKKHGNDERKN